MDLDEVNKDIVSKEQFVSEVLNKKAAAKQLLVEENKDTTIPLATSIGPNVTKKERCLIAVIGDEDTITGFLLAGIGQRDNEKTNFMIVDEKTPLLAIEKTFKEFINRKDIAIVLINQHIANEIRHLLDNLRNPFPAVLEIPSKDKPYDPSKDSILKRAQRIFGNE